MLLEYPVMIYIYIYYQQVLIHRLTFDETAYAKELFGRKIYAPETWVLFASPVFEAYQK